MENEQSARAQRDNETLERIVETLRSGAVEYDEDARDAAEDRSESDLTLALVNASAHRELANVLHGMRSDVRNGLFRKGPIVVQVRTLDRARDWSCEFGTMPPAELVGMGNTLATLGHGQIPCGSPATHDLMAKEHPATSRRLSCTLHLTPMLDRVFLETALRLGRPQA